MEFVQPRSVIDIGCGIGTWLRAFMEAGVDEVVGVDGDYVNRAQLMIPHSSFYAHDLEQPLRLERKFDLALSLEVGEHLASQFAPVLVGSLTRLAPVILFSAAIPGQGGTNHVNEQWPEYWEYLFDTEGFVQTDPLRPQLWYDNRVDPWYRQNLYVFIERKLLEANGRLSALPRGGRDDDLTLVSKYILKRLATPENYLGLRAVLRLFPRLVICSVKRRLIGSR
jgi:SAM-dependent methyltransferase